MGPAGNTAATHAARLGAEVTLVERDVVGGAAHLWDCIPSKAMIATGGALAAVGRAPEMGLTEAAADGRPRSRSGPASPPSRARLEHGIRRLLDSQGVRILQGTGRLVGPPHGAWSTPPTAPGGVEADAILLATGSRPRLPDWAPVDGDRVLSTRDAYPPPDCPSTSS